VVPNTDSSGKPSSFAYNLKVRRIKAIVTKAFKEVNETSIYNNHRIPIAVEILALRYVSLKGKGNPSVNAILAELSISQLNTSRIIEDTSTLGGASTLTTIRTKADAAKSEADDIIKWVTKNDPRIYDTRFKVERLEKKVDNAII
jgi:endonuclease III-like uncharacterized protein